MTTTEDGDDRTTAVGLARFAYEYIAAARIVDEHLGKGSAYAVVSPTPAYFLALHGIELTLKAYLRHHGVTTKELRNKPYMHDIYSCLNKANEFGLQNLFALDELDEKALKLLVELNEYQGLRYIKTGAKEFPLWSIVEPLAVRLHQAVAPNVGFESFTVSFSGRTTPQEDKESAIRTLAEILASFENDERA
ncbi:hypothetical protein [Cupriavidus sp. CP313]